MIYFIRNCHTGHVKIGRAANPEKRLAALQTGNSAPLLLLRTIDGGVDTEAWLHEHFGPLHIRGEWFAFDTDLLGVNPPEETERTPRHNPVASALQKRVGPGKPYSQKAIARIAGCSIGSVGNWVSGASAPNSAALVRLWAALDADFVSECMGGAIVRVPVEAAQKIIDGVQALNELGGQR